MRSSTSALVAAPRRSAIASRSPPPIKSTWASLNPGNDRAPLGVDDDGLGALEAGDLTIGADAQNLVAANGHGLGHRAAPIRGVDGGVPDNEVHRPLTVVALRTDDQAGDQRRGDDRDDNVSGQARRHGWLLRSESRAVQRGAPG